MKKKNLQEIVATGITGNELSLYTCRFREFLREAEKYNISDDEIFLPCISLEEEGKYFNPTWYVSNKGRIISFAYKKPRILKPILKEFSNNKYYYISNSFSGKNVKIHRLVALYFLYDKNRDGEFSELECHHKNSNFESLGVFGINAADNLQLVTKKQHVQLNKIERGGIEAIEAKFKAARELNIPTYEVEDLTEFCHQLIKEQQTIIMAVPGNGGNLESVGYIDTVS